MVYALYSASAPGSFMISGEHAVLRGELALVGAIDKRITVHLKPRSDTQILIRSEPIGTLTTDLKQIEVQAPFEFVLATIRSLKDHLISGFELLITSELPHSIGLSSSAAVTVATLSVLHRLVGITEDSNLAFFHAARDIIRQVQIRGSGADIAAAIFGGILAFQIDPLVIQRLSVPFMPWHLIYTGYKTPTATVIAKVNEDAEQYPQYYDALFQAMGEASQHMRSALTQGEFAGVGHWMMRYGGLQAAMSLVCPYAHTIIQQSMAMPNVYGAKLSGSGLGDCVLVLGDMSTSHFSGAIEVSIAPKGLITHENI